jgi:hypothetical protein
MSHSHIARAAVVTVLATSCAVALLLPVLVSPVGADDRYTYLLTSTQARDSYLGILQYGWAELPTVVRIGRVAPLSSVARRVVALASTQAALATGAPHVVFAAVTKLLLLAACVMAGVALVASLRWRGDDGSLVRARPWTLWLVGIASALALAAGAQAQGQGRNGWTAYPILTYGSFVVVVMTVVLLLVLTRLVARMPTWRVRAIVVIALVALAAVLCLSYELVYVGVPLAALALVVQPVGEGLRRREVVVAKLTTGVPLIGGFAVGLLAVRIYAGTVCAQHECYVGVSPRLGSALFSTLFNNVVSAAPLLTRRYRSDLARVGWADQWPPMPTGWSMAVAIVAGSTLLAAAWLARSAVFPGDSARVRRDRANESNIVAFAALLFVLLALGAALIMSLSVQAQELIATPGVPYRSTVMTWAGLSFAGVLTVTAGGLRGWSGIAAVGGLALVATVMAAGVVVLPRNLLAVRAERAHPAVIATESIQLEAIKGDLSADGARRRCAAQEDLLMARPSDRVYLVAVAERFFRYRFGEPFCDPALARGLTGR